MKPIKAWFSQVRHEPLREKLLRNYEAYPLPHEGAYQSLATAINFGFEWYRTNEGVPYWREFYNCLKYGLTDYHAFLACEAQVKGEVKEYAGKIPKEGQKQYVDQVKDRLTIYNNITKMMDDIKGKINPATDPLESLQEVWQSLMLINTTL